MEIEARIRTAIRDAVNRPSRKPFHWGGLTGYEQLEAIVQALRSEPLEGPESSYLQRLARQVGRAVEKNRILAQDLREADNWLVRIAECLRYPPSSFSVCEASLTSEQVRQEMEALLQLFQPDLKRCQAQAALYNAWHRLWRRWSPDLLHCYDIPGLPPDNLKMESLFGWLRRHQRRISGRKSTRELRDFGQYQVLFLARSEDDLLQQLRRVPLAEYQARRRRLAQAEAPRQFLRRLHRDPLGTMRCLVHQHATRRAALTSSTDLPP